MAASGSILFAADGAALARSAIFERKLNLIAAALANAAAFRCVWNARLEPWADGAPRPATAMAAASDRQRVVSGKSVDVRVDRGSTSINTKQKKHHIQKN